MQQELNNVIIHLVITVFSVLGVYKIYKILLLDRYKQRLFSIRAKAFELFFINNDLISEENYRYLEDIINVNIRYSHKMHILSSIYINKQIEKNKIKGANEIKQKYDAFISYLEKENKIEYLSIIERLNKEIIKYTLFSSPFISVLIFSAFFIKRLFKVILLHQVFVRRSKYETQKPNIYIEIRESYHIGNPEIPMIAL